MKVFKQMGYSEDDLIEALRKADRKHDGVTAREFDQDSEFPAVNTLNRRFGNWNEALRIAGLNVNQSDQSQKIELECEFCEESFQRHQSNKRERDFCSEECYNNSELTSSQRQALKIGQKMSVDLDEAARQKISESRSGIRASPETEFKEGELTGSDHPNWKGGRVRYYGSHWRRQRRKALRRDNNKCQSCGLHEEESEYPLEVHHKIPIREFSDREEANRLSNLITYCKSCHIEEEVRIRSQ